MTKHGYLLHIWTEGDRIEQLIQRVTRLARALTVVLIGTQSNHTSRWPREKNGDRRSLRVLDDLREAVRRIIETIVESMHKYDRFASAGRLRDAANCGAEGWLVQVLGRYSHEVPVRISWWRGRPLDLADLARLVGRN